MLSRRLLSLLPAAFVLASACGGAETVPTMAAAPKIADKELQFSQVRLVKVQLPGAVKPVYVALGQLTNTSKYPAGRPLLEVEYLDAAGNVVAKGVSIQTPFISLAPGETIPLMDSYAKASPSEPEIVSARMFFETTFGVAVAEPKPRGTATIAVEERKPATGGVYIKGTFTVGDKPCRDPQVIVLTRNKAGELASYHAFRVGRQSVADDVAPGTVFDFREGVPVYGDGELPHELIPVCIEPQQAGRARALHQHPARGIAALVGQQEALAVVGDQLIAHQTLHEQGEGLVAAAKAQGAELMQVFDMQSASRACEVLEHAFARCLVVRSGLVHGGLQSRAASLTKMVGIWQVLL